MSLASSFSYEDRLYVYGRKGSNRRERLLRLSLHERLRFGCFLSHVFLWQELLDLNLPFLVILEDDVVVVKNFLSSLTIRLSNLPNHWDLLYLNSCYTHYGALFRYGLQLSRGALCTYGYVISAKGASYLLKIASSPSSKPIDHMLDTEILSGRLLAFHSVPTLVEPLRNVKSTLAYN